MPTDLSISCHESEASENLDCAFSARKKDTHTRSKACSKSQVSRGAELKKNSEDKKEREAWGERGLGRETMVFCTRFLATFFKQMYGTCRTLCRIACNHENVKKYLLNKRTYILQILYCRSFGFKLQIIFSRSDEFLRSLFTWVFTACTQHSTKSPSPRHGVSELCSWARHFTLIMPLSTSDV